MTCKKCVSGRPCIWHGGNYKTQHQIRKAAEFSSQKKYLEKKKLEVS